MTSKAKFDSGRVVITRGIEQVCCEHSTSIQQCLKRHLQGDWGDSCQSDAALNDAALENESGRVLSSYTIGSSKIWIITDGVSKTCSYSTTILLPCEY